jgi:hypothetical protein
MTNRLLPKSDNGSASEIRSTPRLSFARTDRVKVARLKKRLPNKGQRSRFATRPQDEELPVTDSHR